MEKLKSVINKKNFLLAALLFIAGLMLNSCHSADFTDFGKEKDLQIFIIDENNNPVSDFLVSYSSSPKGFRSQEIYTNDKGFCRFENIPSGQFYIWGYKSGFKKMEGISVSFNKPTDVFFCMTESKEFILSEVENLYKKNRFQEGLELLNTIYREKNSLLNEGISFYEIVGLEKMGNTKESYKKIKELKKSKNSEIRKLVEKYYGENNEK